MRRLMFFIVMVLFVCSLNLFGGGKGQIGTTSAESGPVKLTVAMAENLRVKDFETNNMTLLVEKGVNVDMDFMVLPSSDYNQRINLMVMAGSSDLPDVLIGNQFFSDSTVFTWALAGAIIPLTKYYKDTNASANFHEAQKKANANVLPQITMPDGEIYGIPKFNQSMGNEHRAKGWYYEPWLKKLGLQAPATSVEFRNVLKAVVTSDPN